MLASLAYYKNQHDTPFGLTVRVYIVNTRVFFTFVVLREISVNSPKVRPICSYMSLISSAKPVKRPDAGSMVSFRVGGALFEQLKAASKRRNTSVSAYCRDLVAAELQNRNEEGTADIYRVAFKTLEEIEVVKAALFHSMRILFHQDYNAPTPLTSEEKKLPPAEQERRLNDPKRETKGTVFTRRVLDSADNKRAKALEVLRSLE